MERTDEILISGFVEKVYEIQSKESKGKTYNSQLVILLDKSNEKYPKKVAITLKGHAIEKLTIGQQVNLTCSVESREWNGKWFTDISCWNI